MRQILHKWIPLTSHRQLLHQREQSHVPSPNCGHLACARCHPFWMTDTFYHRSTGSERISLCSAIKSFSWQNGGFEWHLWGRRLSTVKREVSQLCCEFINLSARPPWDTLSWAQIRPKFPFFFMVNALPGKHFSTVKRPRFDGLGCRWTPL